VKTFFDFLVDIAPSVVAVFIAWFGIISQRDQRKVDDARADKQRAADDERLRAQREADDRRAVNTYAQQVDTHTRERRAAIAEENAERLRAEAGEFVAALGEAWAAVKVVEKEAHAKLEHHPDLAPRKPVDAAWTPEIETRLSVTVAKMQMFGGKVGETAGEGREKVVGIKDNLVVEAERGAVNDWGLTEQADFTLGWFAHAVQTERARILEESFTSHKSED
jgi:hypothetical protein